MKNFENFLNFFQKTIAIWKVIGYNKYIKVVKSGVTVDKSGAKGGLKMLYGRYEHTVDAKNRVFVPA